MADSRNLVLQLLITAKDQASEVLERVFSALNDTTNVIAGKIRAAFTNLFGGALDSAIAFEAQLDQVQAKGDYTTESMTALKQAAIEIGQQFGLTGTEAAQGMEALAAAGLNATEVMQALPSVLALARAEGLGMDEAAEKLSDSLAAVGLGFDQAARMADVLAKGAKLSTTEASALAQALSTAGGIAKTAGLNLEQTVAALTALAAAGIKGEKAGTALQAILTQLLNPASQASQELGELGITTRDLGGVIEGLAGKGAAGNAAILAFGETAGPGLRALITQGSGALGELETGLRNAAGAARQTADEMAGNLRGALQALGSAWDNIKTALLLPVLEPLAQSARDAARALNDNLNSGALKPIQDAIKDFVVSGIQAVKDFMAGWNFTDAKTALTDFATGAKDAFNGIRDAGATAAEVVSVVWNTAAATLRTISAAMLEIAASAVQTLSNLESFASKIGLGTIQRANELAARAAELDQRARDIFAGVNTNVERLKTAFNDLTADTDRSAAAQNRLKAALPVQEIQTLAKSIEDYRAIAERANAAADQAREDFLNGKIAAADYAKAVLSAAQANEDLKGASERGAQATQANTAATRAAVDQSTRLATQFEAQIEAQQRLSAQTVAAAEAQSRQVDLNGRLLQASYDLAVALGREGEARQWLIAIAQNEANQAQAAAITKRTEATAALEVLKLLEQEAGRRLENGELIDAEIKKRIDAARVAAETAAIEAEAAGQVAEAQRLRTAAIGQISGLQQQNTQQIEQNTQATDQNSESKKVNVKHTNDTTAAVQGLAGVLAQSRAQMDQLGERARAFYEVQLASAAAAQNMADSTHSASDAWAAWYKSAGQANDVLVDYGQKLIEARKGVRQFSEELLQATNGIDRMETTILLAKERTKVAFYEQATAAEQLAESLGKMAEGAHIDMGVLNQAVMGVNGGFDLLDQQNLSNLKSAIEAVNQRLAETQQAAEDARTRLMELDAELAEAKGQKVQADLLRQQLDYQQQLAEIEQARQEAQAAGNQELILLYDQQASKLAELNRLKEQNIKTQAAPAPSAPSAPSASAGGGAPSGASGVTVNVNASGARVLDSAFVSDLARQLQPVLGGITRRLN